MEWFKKGYQALITLSIPIIISVLAVLVLLSPVFIYVEYHRPGFPEDSYGFSTAERMDFGNQTRKYLVSSDSLDDLRTLRFPNGDPIYKESELTHGQIQAVFEALARKAKSHLMKNGSGIFKIPELGLKIARKTKPATKSRMGRNPSTGEEMMIAAKPKRDVIRAMPLKMLKEVLQG